LRIDVQQFSVSSLTAIIKAECKEFVFFVIASAAKQSYWQCDCFRASPFAMTIIDRELLIDVNNRE
jgi:hypothetical protein